MLRGTDSNGFEEGLINSFFFNYNGHIVLIHLQSEQRENILKFDFKNKATENKRNLVNFIENTFNEFDRMVEYTEGEDENGVMFELPYKLNEEFIDHNSKTINKLGLGNILWLEKLSQKIELNMIILSPDYEYIDFKVNSFYFNQDDKFIIVNPR